MEFDYEKEFKDIENWIGIYFPKLEGLRNTGSASTIHNINSTESIIDSALHNAKKFLENKTFTNDKYPKLTLDGQLDLCHRVMLETEEWLKEIARRG